MVNFFFFIFMGAKKNVTSLLFDNLQVLQEWGWKELISFSCLVTFFTTFKCIYKTANLFNLILFLLNKTRNLILYQQNSNKNFIPNILQNLIIFSFFPIHNKKETKTNQKRQQKEQNLFYFYINLVVVVIVQLLLLSLYLFYLFIYLFIFSLFHTMKKQTLIFILYLCIFYLFIFCGGL